MTVFLQILGWLACVVYSTIPSFWFMIHPFAERWRKRRSPFLVLVPAWILMWIVAALITQPWHRIILYSTPWGWSFAIPLFALGLFLYSRSGGSFSAKHLGGLPEVQGSHRQQQLVTTGIRSHVRHPVYLAHLCEMLAWSLGDGVCRPHRNHHDPNGRQRIRAALRRYVSRLSRLRSGSSPAASAAAPAIIRFG